MAIHWHSVREGEAGEKYRNVDIEIEVLGDGLIKYRDYILTRHEAEQLIDCLEAGLRHYGYWKLDKTQKADNAARKRYCKREATTTHDDVTS